jgi:alpha-galactosidase
VSPFSYELVAGRGTVLISWAERATLRATAGVCFRRGEEPITLTLADVSVQYTQEDNVYTQSAHSEAVGVELTWRWTQLEDERAEVTLEISNRGAEPMAMQHLDVLSAEGEMPESSGWRFYQNGWNSWSPTLVRTPEGGLYTPPVFDPAMHLPHPGGNAARLRSEWFTVLCAPGQSLLLGFVSAADQLAEVHFDEHRRLVARCYLDDVLLAPGQTMRSETLLVRTGPDPIALLEDYADTLGSRMDARVGESPPPTGWCSWYYFFVSSTAQNVLDNLHAIDEMALDLEVIQVDDGFQMAIGDWLSIDEARYPEGMAAIAGQIREAGRRAGIWTAPFGVAQESALFEEHPDWIVRSAEGAPILAWNHMVSSSQCYGLDLSHPDVLDWLEETFRTLREWGYTYFKIDFLFAGALPGVRSNPSVTRAQALRRGLEAIRRGVGEESYILGCGAPLGPCVGLVDGMRIGPDVNLTWEPMWQDFTIPAVSNAIRSTLARAFMHNRLWHNDPDCLIVRSRRDQSNLVLNEMRSLTSVVALCGGLALDSDHMPKLGLLGRFRYLQRVLPPTDQSARVVDLFRQEAPSQMVLPIERPWGQWWVVGLLNWDDRTTTTRVTLDELGIPPGVYHVYNYWMDRYQGIAENELVARRHQPHETRVLGLRLVGDEPDLLASTLHIAQGAVEISSVVQQRDGDALHIQIDLVKPGEQFGDLLFTVPKGWRMAGAYINRQRRHPTRRAKGVYGLGFTLSGTARVEAIFVEE